MPYEMTRDGAIDRRSLYRGSSVFRTIKLGISPFKPVKSFRFARKYDSMSP